MHILFFFPEWRLIDFPKEYSDLRLLIQSGKVENVKRYFDSLIQGDLYFLSANTFYPFGHGVPSTLPPSEPRKSYTDTGRPELHRLEVTMQSLVMVACEHPYQSLDVINYFCQRFSEYVSLDQLEWSYHQLHAWSCVAPLHVACTGYNQNLKLVKVLVKLGADVNLKSGCCQVAPLHLAVASYGGGQAIDIARYLIDNGANVNAVDHSGDTPLTLMLRFCGGSEYKRVMDLLLSKEADVNHANNLGFTALHYAALNNDIDAVVSLLSLGASPLFELAEDPSSSLPCPLYLTTLEEVADIFTSRSDCPLTCKIDSLLLIGVTKDDHDNPYDDYVDSDDSDDSDDIDARDNNYVSRYAMWTRAIALREEHGIILSGDYSIDGISEIKNADEVKECFQNTSRSTTSTSKLDTDPCVNNIVIQTHLIRERCLRYFSSLDDLNAIHYSVDYNRVSVSILMKCLKPLAHSFHNTILPHWSLGVERYWQQKISVLTDILSMIDRAMSEKYGRNMLSLSHVETYAELCVGVLQALNHSYHFALCTKTTSMHIESKNAIWSLVSVLVRWVSWLGMTDPSSDDTTFHPLRQVVQKLVDQNLYLMNTTLLHLIPIYFSECDDVKDIVFLYELILQSDGTDSAVNFVSSEGNRPLHCVAKSAGHGVPQCLSLVLSLYESGAHLDAVDKHSKSAHDYLREMDMTSHLEQYIPSSPLPLACLVSQTIVKENIPYLRMDIVPSKLKKFIALHDSHCCVYSS